jgi:hypothetical protein
LQPRFGGQREEQQRCDKAFDQVGHGHPLRAATGGR